jgi:hypothetical protein
LKRKTEQKGFPFLHQKYSEDEMEIIILFNFPIHNHQVHTTHFGWICHPAQSVEKVYMRRKPHKDNGIKYHS